MPAKNYKDTSIRYNQENRTIEKFLKDLRASKQIGFSLESCNVCSTACGIEAIGGTFNFPKIDFMSAADIMFNYIYSFPKGLPVMDGPNGLCENECIENLAFAVKSISNCDAECYYNGDNKKLVDAMIEALKDNVAIVASYADSTTTGHYLCFVNYDSSKKVFNYYDSWKGNSRNKNGGCLEEFSYDDLIGCIKHRYMVIHLK